MANRVPNTGSSKNETNIPDKRSSFEHEYIFDEIPKGPPLSQPTPKTKRPSDDDVKRTPGEIPRTGLTISSKDKNTNASVPVNDSQSPAQTGIGDAKNQKNVEISRHELYKEAMYTCMHMLGTPSPQRFPATQEEMCLYVHEVFSQNEKEQDAVLDHVRNEPFPLTIVNAKVRRAVGLKGSKPNGFVDPYCIVTIETEDSLGKKEWQQFSTASPMKKKDLSQIRSTNLRPPPESRSMQVYEKVPDFIKTSVQRHNPDPRWNQRFQCLALRPSVDKLTLEVWDHSIDDKYVAKAIRNTEPSSNSDLDSRLKSAHANAERKYGDHFLGKASIRISEVPCDGKDHWYILKNETDKDDHGKLRVQIWFVHAYRHGKHFTEVAEPKIILANFWDWVLKAERKNCVNPDKWDGSISAEATCFLFQYALQNGISEETHAIIRWNAYAKLDLNLNAVEGQLRDLNEVIEKHVEASAPAPQPIKDSQADIEANILEIVMTRIVPLIRNHLNEKVSDVHEALRSYQECVQLLTNLEKPQLLEKIRMLVYSALRMSILEWYQEVYNATVPTHGDVKKHEFVSGVVKVITKVNELLRLGAKKWSPEFILTASIEYLPVVFDELQKMVIHDVEATCWIFFQFFGDYKKLRRILLGFEENDKNLSRDFFDLYAQTQTFVVAWGETLPNGLEGYSWLQKYPRWFRPTLVLWLGFALIRGSMMISKSILIDNNVQDNEYAMTSSSALDTANVFCQLVKFWEALNWPDIPEAYVIINFLSEVIFSYTILYTEMKHAKLEREGYYDPRGKFTISERLCTAMNNIEYVKEQAEKIPQDIKHEDLVKLLEDACGSSETVITYQMRMKDRLEQTTNIVNKHLDDIVIKVGSLIQKEILVFIRRTLNSVLDASSDELEHTVNPIKDYLEDNILTLEKALLPFNFHKMLLVIWNLVCRGIEIEVFKFSLEGIENQYIFFKKVIKVLPELEIYFEGGDAGLSESERDTESYRSLLQTLNYFTMETDELIRIYYHSRAQYCINYKGEENFGTIKVRIGYWNNKLGIDIVSATDLTPHDEPLTVLKYFKKMQPTSDPMVEVELKPITAFSNEKKQITKVKWKNLNPVFEETFYWKISSDECVQPSAVLVLTVKDYDLLTRNAFLGEAVIPLHLIPGISRNAEPQPMILTLHEVDPNDPVLLVLKTRTWDDEAKQFTGDQLARFVEPVIARTKKIKQ